MLLEHSHIGTYNNTTRAHLWTKQCAIFEIMDYMSVEVPDTSTTQHFGGMEQKRGSSYKPNRGVKILSTNTDSVKPPETRTLRHNLSPLELGSVGIFLIFT